MVAGNEHFSQHSAEEPAAGLGSGVYVDVENLGTAAQEFIQALMNSWPDNKAPAPSLLSLYVRADQSALWRMWAESHFSDVAVKAKGIQHFSNTPAKNSADIAIAVDALSDFLNQRVAWVVVVSDDSDFIALYSKIRDERVARGHQPGDVPFLWVVTDRPRTRSLFMQEFFPNSHVHTVPFPKAAQNEPEKVEGNLPQEVKASPTPKNAKALEDMAQAIIREVPVGKFKSSDCQKIIKSQWPKHALAKASGQNFGVEFRKELWPILQASGALEPNSNRQPRRYEMTPQAKASLQG